MYTTIPTAYTGNNRLMLITHRNNRLTEYEEAKLAIEGGCTWVQLRMKGTINLKDAQNLAKLCKEKNVRLCIDDNVEIALASGANTVHLGKNDMPIADAWKLVKTHYQGNDFQIGATANTFEDIQKAIEQGASYIGLGPFRFTQTKEKLSPVLGLEGYQKIIKQCREAGIQIPIYAIGGIEAADVPLLMKTGITGIAVSGAINQAENPTKATQEILSLLNNSPIK